MVAYALKSKGGFVWACKNYDGEVEKELIKFGSGKVNLWHSFVIRDDKYTSWQIFERQNNFEIFWSLLYVWLKIL